MVGNELHLEAVFFDESSARARRASDQGNDPEKLGREVAAKLHEE
jgi:RNA 3'-terminal phosphate cyclase